MWRLLFMIAMLLHSIGHILFLMNTWGYWKTANERAWLFADGLKLGQTGEGIIGVLWLAPLLGFLIGTWGFFAHQTWWGPFALTAAILGQPLVTGGPYRWLHHPNYVAVVVEGFALPLVHTAWITAVAFTVAALRASLPGIGVVVVWPEGASAEVADQRVSPVT